MNLWIVSGISERSEEKKAKVEDLTAIFNYRGSAYGEGRTTLFSGAQRKDERQQTQVAAREIHIRKKESILHNKQQSKLNSFSRKVRISILGDFWNLAGRGAEEADLALKLRCLEQGVELDHL